MGPVALSAHAHACSFPLVPRTSRIAGHSLSGAVLPKSTITLPHEALCMPPACRLWTDDDNRQLVKEHYPWFLDTYDSLPKPVMKADASRYLYMHHIGGGAPSVLWLFASQLRIALSCSSTAFCMVSELPVAGCTMPTHACSAHHSSKVW